MDQALEKAYNKPAKSSTGIIGFTRRKEAIVSQLWWRMYSNVETLSILSNQRV